MSTEMDHSKNTIFTALGLPDDFDDHVEKLYIKYQSNTEKKSEAIVKIIEHIKNDELGVDTGGLSKYEIALFTAGMSWTKTDMKVHEANNALSDIKSLVEGLGGSKIKEGRFGDGQMDPEMEKLIRGMIDNIDGQTGGKSNDGFIEWLKRKIEGREGGKKDD